MLWMLEDFIGSKGDWKGQQGRRKKIPLKGATNPENNSGPDSP